MIVGPTVLMASIGTGALARCTSSKKMSCSMGVRPWPPYSFGQPTPSHPSRPIWRTSSLYNGPSQPLSARASSTSGVMSEVKYSRSSWRRATCSGVKAKSMSKRET